MITQKTALVVGGSGGIGRAICKRLIEDGFFVCATYARSGGRAEAFRHELKGKSIAWYQMDLLKGGAVNRLMGEILAVHPRIDLLIFGPTLPAIHKALLECSWGDFEAHLHVQLRGMVEIIKNLKEQIRDKQPIKYIVILTEACIGKPPSHMSPYVTAKYALMGFTKTVAAELMRYGCTANMISPGMVATDLLSDFPAKAVELAAAKNPSGTIAKPEDVARIVSFLASDAAKNFNGMNFNLNGDAIV